MKQPEDPATQPPAEPECVPLRSPVHESGPTIPIRPDPEPPESVEDLCTVPLTRPTTWPVHTGPLRGDSPPAPVGPAAESVEDLCTVPLTRPPTQPLQAAPMRGESSPGPAVGQERGGPRPAAASRLSGGQTTDAPETIPLGAARPRAALGAQAPATSRESPSSKFRNAWIGLAIGAVSTLGAVLGYLGMYADRARLRSDRERIRAQAEAVRRLVAAKDWPAASRLAQELTKTCGDGTLATAEIEILGRRARMLAARERCQALTESTETPEPPWDEIEREALALLRDDPSFRGAGELRVRAALALTVRRSLEEARRLEAGDPEEADRLCREAGKIRLGSGNALHVSDLPSLAAAWKELDELGARVGVSAGAKRREREARALRTRAFEALARGDHAVHAGELNRAFVLAPSLPDLQEELETAERLKEAAELLGRGRGAEPLSRARVLLEEIGRGARSPQQREGAGQLLRRFGPAIEIAEGMARAEELLAQGSLREAKESLRRLKDHHRHPPAETMFYRLDALDEALGGADAAWERARQAQERADLSATCAELREGLACLGRLGAGDLNPVLCERAARLRREIDERVEAALGPVAAGGRAEWEAYLAAGRLTTRDLPRDAGKAVPRRFADQCGRLRHAYDSFRPAVDLLRSGLTERLPDSREALDALWAEVERVERMLWEMHESAWVVNALSTRKVAQDMVLLLPEFPPGELPFRERTCRERR